MRNIKFRIQKCIFAVQSSSHEVGLEADFYVEEDGERVDWTAWRQLRHRLLRARGWTVVLLPYWDWKTLRDGPAQDLYLRRELVRAGAAPPQPGEGQH